MELKILPSNIANMIAAGEVVQRPSSVVKELMENAVDAGASQVTVVIADAGRTLIQVVDNGCGMDPDEAVLCFERHATSKIATAEDLAGISTYGFRGEALSSIAAVAEVTLRTRKEGESLGCEVVFADSKHVSTSETACPTGCNFAVRNLFYNVPARRKFLKSDNVEFKHITEEFTRVAIPRPEVSFTLTHNGREIFVLRPAKSLNFRIMDIIGRGVAGDLVDLGADTGVVRISGFTGSPRSARKAPGNQYFFVGGRYFRSPYLHKAVMKAYEEFLPEGQNPPYFIFLEVDPGAMDVNIHPTKTEIKFEDDNVIFQVLSACVREALGRNSFSAGIDFNTEGAVSYPAFGSSFAEYKPVTEAPLTTDPTFDPFGDSPREPAPSLSGRAPSNDGPYAFGGLSRGAQDPGVLFEQDPSDAIVLQGRYIASRSASGLMLVHIRRAWERIAYERALASLSGSAHVSQTALFPVQVQVGVQQALVLQEHAGMLATLGFDITLTSPDTVSVGGVPEGYSCEPGKVEALVQDLLLVLSDGGEALPEVMRQKTAAKFAMLAASNAEAPRTPMAVRQLLDTLFASDNAEFTPNGKRIISVLGAEELEKRFQ